MQGPGLRKNAKIDHIRRLLAELLGHHRSPDIARHASPERTVMRQGRLEKILEDEGFEALIGLGSRICRVGMADARRSAHGAQSGPQIGRIVQRRRHILKHARKIAARPVRSRDLREPLRRGHGFHRVRRLRHIENDI
jgi:hypothetical protein